jgi:hypothetical protein
MAEKDLSAMFRDELKRYGHIQRIESMTGLGVPDVNYCFSNIEGWVELKCLPRWPKRPETIVTIEHYTQQQRLWIRTRANAGGRVYLLLEVIAPRPISYLLFGPVAAVNQVGRVNRAILERLALVSSGPSGTFPAMAIKGELTSNGIRG